MGTAGTRGRVGPCQGCLLLSGQRFIVPGAPDPAPVCTVAQHPHLRLRSAIPPSSRPHRGSVRGLLYLHLTPDCYFSCGSAYGLLTGLQPHYLRPCKSRERKVSSHTQRQVRLHSSTAALSQASGGPRGPLTQPEPRSGQLGPTARRGAAFCCRKARTGFFEKEVIPRSN